MDADVTTLGHRIRHFRTRRGMTLDELGAAAGVAASQLSLIENGKREPRVTLLSGLAAALGVQLADLLSAETGLAGAMSRLMVVSEQYPDLKANQNMMQLTEEMTSTENKISFARQAYNDSVMTYNTARESFPTNILAGMFNFAEAQLFQIENAAERAAPQVKFT